jgi:hypothetical protein
VAVALTGQVVERASRMGTVQCLGRERGQLSWAVWRRVRREGLVGSGQGRAVGHPKKGEAYPEMEEIYQGSDAKWSVSTGYAYVQTRDEGGCLMEASHSMMHGRWMAVVVDGLFEQAKAVLDVQQIRRVESEKRSVRVRLGRYGLHEKRI